jgi:cytochrome c
LPLARRGRRRGESACRRSIAEARTFRGLARKYPLHNLEEALAEGIVVGHEGVEMPQFRLSAAQIEALLVYLNSIQR